MQLKHAAYVVNTQLKIGQRGGDSDSEDDEEDEPFRRTQSSFSRVFVPEL